MTLNTNGERSIQEVARLAGTTSRTLRHYQAKGLLLPSRVGENGYRYYDDRSLVRLQRILLLRQLGLGLDTIRTVLDDEPDTANALRLHLEWLRSEQERLMRQIASVEHTIDAEEGGGRIMAEKVFDGFDHTQYKAEVEQRWGTESYANSDRWWRSMSDAERLEWQERLATLNADWQDAAVRGVTPSSDEAQALAERHAQWLASVPGIPRSETGAPTREYLEGLAEMYVADDRFGANYGGTPGAELVRDALQEYAARTL